MHTARIALLAVTVLIGHFMPAEPVSCVTPAGDTGRELVVILHGYGRTARHMRYLRAHLAECGYDVYTPTLPTFFRSVDACADILDGMLAEQNLDGYRRVHFVGHSMGGLIIRRYLADHALPNPGRCVLIGTPNGGTGLAKVAVDWLVPLVWISPAIDSFKPGGMVLPPPLNDPPPLMGAIAGTRRSIFSDWLIEGENDGMVPVASVPFPGMDDFIELPFNHDELPFRDETAAAVERFLRDGRFPDMAGN